MVASIFKLISLGFNLIACCIWFLASHFHPGHELKHEKWYGFAPFKIQYLISATLGILGSVIGLCAIFFPFLIIPSVWLFFCSNVIWSMGEYHKFKSPPLEDPLYSHRYQKTYFSYAITMTAIGFTTALATSLIVIFPPIAMLVLIVATTISIGLGLLAAQYWLEFNLGFHPKTNAKKDSYHQMQEVLGVKKTSLMDNTPRPYHTASSLSLEKTVVSQESDDLQASGYTPT